MFTTNTKYLSDIYDIVYKINRKGDTPNAVQTSLIR